ncbi:TPA: hypothetical protein ACP5S6_002844 [Vibrio parahaemolyticus]
MSDNQELNLDKLKEKLATQEKAIEDSKKKIEDAEAEKQALLKKIEDARQAEKETIFDNAIESVKEHSLDDFIVHTISKNKVSVTKLIKELVRTKIIKKSELTKLTLANNASTNDKNIPALYFAEKINGKVVEHLVKYANDKLIGKDCFFKDRVKDNTIDKYKVTHAQWDVKNNKWIVWNDMCKTECPWDSNSIEKYKLPYTCSVLGKQLYERKSYSDIKSKK